MRYLDLHIHGAFGVDLLSASEAELDRLAQGLESRGYGSFLPTLVPLPNDELEPVLERLGAWQASRIARDGRGAMPLGIHLEGPFVNPQRSGALNPQSFLDGTRESEVRRFFDLIGQVPGNHMVTLAPEIPGGDDIIREFVKLNFLVSAGHTCANLDTLEQAFAAGVRHMTHFCNAMTPLHHRDPGPIAFGLVQDEISIDVIADGKHIHPLVLDLIFKTKPRQQIALISDATPAAGEPDGDYDIWGEKITIRDGEARNEAGNLAGSACLLSDCVGQLEEIGVPRTEAVECASTVPLRILRGES